MTNPKFVQSQRVQCTKENGIVSGFILSTHKFSNGWAYSIMLDEPKGSNHGGLFFETDLVPALFEEIL